MDDGDASHPEPTGLDAADSGETEQGPEGGSEDLPPDDDVAPGVTDTGPASNLVSLRPMLEIVGLVLAPISLIASVLVYFGIVRTQVEADFFGVDPAVYGYSSQDHVARSIAPLLGPLAVAGVAVALIVQANAWFSRHVDEVARWRWSRPAALWTARAGFALIVIGAFWQWQVGSRHSYGAPLFLGVGGVLAAAGTGINAMIATHRRRPDERVSPASALGAGSKVALSFVIVFAAFGSAARLAQADGFDRALALATDLERRPSVTVLSEDVLGINHRGVVCLEVRGSRFTRRYLGLHLLANRNGRYLLIPNGFDRNSAITIDLVESPAIRVEYDVAPVLRAAAGRDPAPSSLRTDPNLLC